MMRRPCTGLFTNPALVSSCVTDQLNAGCVRPYRGLDKTSSAHVAEWLRVIGFVGMRSCMVVPHGHISVRSRPVCSERAIGLPGNETSRNAFLSQCRSEERRVGKECR